MNHKLAQKVVDHLRLESTDVDMDSWAENQRKEVVTLKNCGTSACIAGWACLVAGYEIDLRAFKSKADGGDWDYIEDDAAHILELRGGQAYVLFHHDNWPDKLLELYDENKNEAAAQALEMAMANQWDEFDSM